ncbi:MAG: endonuclease Q family protein [Patescibacteria group bacterium]|jgi:uncharacterized protein (TIGR00375 family)
MSEYIVDFHLHSKYSRAVSRDMNLEEMSIWGEKKGIDVLACADFTHPEWFRELRTKLVLQPNGLYKLKGTKTHFILSTELSAIYTQDGKVHRIHIVIILPTLETIEKFNASLAAEGANLKADGRPILGMSAEHIAGLAKQASPKAMIIPAHIWTPWFSMFGSKSGFNSLKECFGKFAKDIHAVETGLSSDPAMNWRLSQLDDIQIVSSSDAHSMRKMGREATVFELDSLSYDSIRTATENPNSKNKIAYTIEFFPEEGKYHFDGHMKCKVRMSPGETKRAKGICPKCGRPVTVGVMNRVENLADRPEMDPKNPPAMQAKAFEASRPPFKSIVPLQEIIADAFGVGDASKRVQAEYEKIIAHVGNEFFVLLHAPKEKIAEFADEMVVEGIMRVREGKLHILPGFDGEFGMVKVFTDEERKPRSKQKSLL